MTTPRLCALAMAGALGASAGCAQDSAERNQVAQPAAVASSIVAPQPPAPPALDPRTLGWPPGVYYEYALRLSATVSFGNGAKGFDFDLTGTLRVTPATATAEATTLYLGIANPKFVSRVQGSQSQFDKVATEIRGTGCFVTLSGGRVTTDYLRPGLNATAANVYRDVAAALQFARAADGAPQYTAEEYDTTGQYVAEYRFDADHSLWLKHKLRYVAILAANSAPAGTPSHVVPQVHASEGDVVSLARRLSDCRPQDRRDRPRWCAAPHPVHVQAVPRGWNVPPGAGADAGLERDAWSDGPDRREGSVRDARDDSVARQRQDQRHDVREGGEPARGHGQDEAWPGGVLGQRCRD